MAWWRFCSRSGFKVILPRFHVGAPGHQLLDLDLVLKSTHRVVPCRFVQQNDLNIYP